MGLRAGAGAAGLRPAPEADPDHDGRHDHRRRIDQGRVGADARRHRNARGAARRVHDRRCDGREVPHGRHRDRPRRARDHAVHAEPHQARPADPRRRAGPRDGREPGLPHPAPVRRRVRRRLGPRRPRRRVVGHLPASGAAADRRARERADLHRDHHRRPGLDDGLPGRRAAGRADGELHRLSGAQGRDVLEHRADGSGAVVAAAGSLSRREPVGAGPC